MNQCNLYVKRSTQTTDGKHLDDIKGKYKIPHSKTRAIPTCCVPVCTDMIYMYLTVFN